LKTFKDYAYYYNAFYQREKYKEEAAHLDKLLKRYGKNILTLINYGCGTGRHDIELVNLGYQCQGIDVSTDMIGIAKANAKKEKVEIDYFAADIRHFNSEKKYDAVISLFHVMSYQNSNKDVVDSFSSARGALNKDGLFIFDVWYGPGVLSDKPGIRVKEAEDDKNRLVRIARPVMHDKTNIVDVCYEIFVINKETGNTYSVYETHRMRYFFRPELEFFLKEAGFELIDNLDCKTLEDTDFTSWTSYFIARAV